MRAHRQLCVYDGAASCCCHVCVVRCCHDLSVCACAWRLLCKLSDAFRPAPALTWCHACCRRRRQASGPGPASVQAGMLSDIRRSTDDAAEPAGARQRVCGTARDVCGRRRRRGRGQQALQATVHSGGGRGLAHDAAAAAARARPCCAPCTSPGLLVRPIARLSVPAQVCDGRSAFAAG